MICFYFLYLLLSLCIYTQPDDAVVGRDDHDDEGKGGVGGGGMNASYSDIMSGLGTAKSQAIGRAFRRKRLLPLSK